MTTTTIATVLAAYGPALMELQHVVAVGESLCNGEPCIRVYLAEVDHLTLNEIPAKLDGITVIKEISGPVSARGGGLL